MVVAVDFVYRFAYEFATYSCENSCHVGLTFIKRQVKYVKDRVVHLFFVDKAEFVDKVVELHLK